ncbi:MAG TPA: serine--tRNA ligase [Patescibacteria group bacterium]|nr:serine--tRNA ligase [Patescibacteria group bacterium]
MIDIKLLRENPEYFQEQSAAKGVKISVSHILEIDAKQKELSQAVQTLREERNMLVAAMKGKPTLQQIETGKSLKERLDRQEAALSAVDEELRRELLKIPNPVKPDVKIAKSELENEVIKKVGTPKSFDFPIKDHLELGEILGVIDVKTAAKISGARFDYLMREGALLEFALKQLAFDVLVKEGFIPVIPPVLVRTSIMEDLGYTQMGEEENIFHLDKDDLYLVGTSEQSIVPLFKDSVIPKEELPKRFVGFSTCFRREAGSYGKDTKGIFRVHQFDKVEMVCFVAEGEDDTEHEYLLSLEEKLFGLLEIPYQVIRICSGDLGFNAARKYDIEAWFPSQGKYREVTSTSTVTDFQSRRLNMKYQDGPERKYLQVLNGTAFSMNRPIAAILENYQQQDGSVVVPEILRKYIGKDILSPLKK